MCNPKSEYILESDPFFIKGRDLFNSMKVKCFTNARPLDGIRRGQDYIRDVMKKSESHISSDEQYVRMDHIMLGFPVEGMTEDYIKIINAVICEPPFFETLQLCKTRDGKPYYGALFTENYVEWPEILSMQFWDESSNSTKRQEILSQLLIYLKDETYSRRDTVYFGESHDVYI